MDDVQTRNWLTKEEATAFIGKNTDYYLDKWKCHPNSIYKGWNWAAAIFRVEWMAYRKMYAEAVLVLIAVVIIGFLVDGLLSLFHLSVPDGLARFLVQILLGAFANSLYRNKALRVLHNAGHMDDPQRIHYLTKKGGTSIWGLILLLGLEISIFVIPSILLRYV